jgi:hypothetical protein
MAKRTGHQGSRNPPGYVCPKRQDRKGMHIYLEPALHAAVSEITKREGTTIQAAVEQLCAAYVSSDGKIPMEDCEPISSTALANAFFGRPRSSGSDGPTGVR